MKLMEFSSVLSKTFDLRMSVSLKWKLYKLVLQHFQETLHVSQTCLLLTGLWCLIRLVCSLGANPRILACLRDQRQLLVKPVEDTAVKWLSFKTVLLFAWLGFFFFVFFCWWSLQPGKLLNCMDYVEKHGNMLHCGWIQSPAIDNDTVLY